MVNLMGRRMFQTTRARLSSPYHYPEGPYSNLPFNTKTRFFGLRYFLYCFTGFFAPFGIAGASFPRQLRAGPEIDLLTLSEINSLADLQAQGVSRPRGTWPLVGHRVIVGRDRRWNAHGSCTYIRTIEVKAVAATHSSLSSLPSALSDASGELIVSGAPGRMHSLCSNDWGKTREPHAADNTPLRLGSTKLGHTSAPCQSSPTAAL